MISGFEHHAVLDPTRWLGENDDAEIIEIPISRSGKLDLEFLQSLVKNRGDEIALISVMHVNNEIGTIQPIKKIVEIADQKSIPVHTDAVQSLGKVKVSYAELGVFAMTISAHKVGGPVGVGALILKKGIEITPLLHGGGQERDIRSGTFNAPGIVAFVAAAQAAERDREKNLLQVEKVREAFLKVLTESVSDFWINGEADSQIPAIINIRFTANQNFPNFIWLEAGSQRFFYRH